MSAPISTVRLAARALVLVALTPALRGQSLPPLSACEGQLAGERRGSSVADAGDLNGDGAADHWVGSPFDSTAGIQRGALRAISGADGSVLYTIQGSAAVDHFGWSMAVLGDLDGDGIRDLAVGAPDNDFQALNAGAVRIVSGANGATLFSVNGFATGGGLGYSVSSAGDVNGDGFDDFNAGAPFESSSGAHAGSMGTYSGVNGAVLAVQPGAQAGDRLGISVACAGDLDADGRPDQIAGADQLDTGTGYARIYSGRTAATLSTLYGLWSGERFGCAVAGGLDLDGDALADVAVGASAALPSGAVRVHSGASGALRFTLFGAGAGEGFGSALALMPDLDGDGRSDLAVAGAVEAGAIGAAGVVRTISSRTQRPIRVWRGRSGGDRFGASLAAASDRDGDGVFDLIAGAPKDDTPFVDCGVAFVLSTRSALPVVYCSAKLNSQGCRPKFAATGYASASAGAALEIAVLDVLNNKPGLFLFGGTRAATPFLGGTLCLAPPIQRSGAVNSAGHPGASDCSGVLRLSIDGNSVSAMGWSVGQRIDAQAWYRDPVHPDGTASGLSDALEFSIWL